MIAVADSSSAEALIQLDLIQLDLIQVNDERARKTFIGAVSVVSKRPAMNHQHRKTLHALFAHPIGTNIDFKKVVHLLEDAGAEVDNKAGNRIGVKLNGHSAAFTHAHHDLPKEELIQVRKFLESCDITPEKYPL